MYLPRKSANKFLLDKVIISFIETEYLAQLIIELVQVKQRTLLGICPKLLIGSRYGRNRSRSNGLLRCKCLREKGGTRRLAILIGDIPYHQHTAELVMEASKR